MLSSMAPSPTALAAILHRNPATRSHMAHSGGVEVVLNHYLLDDANPYLREWAILATKHMCEECPEAQARVEALQ